MADGAQHWNEVYATKDASEVSWFEEDPTTSLELIELLSPNPNAGVVDVGGGASPLARVLVERGWRDVAVLDLSAAALELNAASLGARSGEVDWVVADVTTWQPARRYGLWHDRAVLHFLVDPADQASYAATLTAAVAPGGSVVIGTFAPDGPEACSGLPVARYDAEGIAALLGPRFVLVGERRAVHVTPWGAEQRFSWAALRAVGAA